MKFRESIKIINYAVFFYVSTGLLIAVILSGFYLLTQMGGLVGALLSGIGMTIGAVIAMRWLIRVTLRNFLRRFASEISEIGTGTSSLSHKNTVAALVPELSIVHGEIAKKSASIENYFKVIQEVTDSLIDAVREIEEASAQHMRCSDNQATSIVKATSTVHNIRKSGESSRNESHQIITLADQSARISEKGLTAVESTNKINLQINHQAKSIVTHTESLRAKVLESAQDTERIKEITGKLGILSVNAAIEAAKAGKFGRGFNIVSQEIKLLNAQSKQATKDVIQRLKNIESTMLDVLDVANEGYAQSLSGIQSIRNAKHVIQQLSEIINNSVKNASVISESFDKQMSGIYRISDEMKTLNDSAMASVKGTMQIRERSARIKKTFATFREKAVLGPGRTTLEDANSTMEGETENENDHG